MQYDQLIQETVSLGMGKLTKSGAVVVETGQHTGRATKERFIVRRHGLDEIVDWGKVNQPMTVDFADEFFAKLENKVRKGKNYSMKGYVGGFPITVTSLSPWHVAFARNMFREYPIKSIQSLNKQNVEITVYHDPFGKVSQLGLNSPTETLIVLDPALMRVGIIGTAYAGEIKKSAFTLCNFKLPEFGVFPMHASANCLEDGSSSCVLFGLSGTGKTTLSAASDRFLIGDDEIVWGPAGLSNLEGGCYAKLIDLSAEKEPEIHRACTKKGAILENVVVSDSSGEIEFSNRSKTENTRGSYPISALEKVFDQAKESQHPKNIIFLTADAFGAMPAVAQLDSNQAQYHFLSGYTSKVAGTEMGVKEPQVAFSTCFGAPFMPRLPSVYAKLLADYSKKHQASVWLLNTGWMNGGYGKGERFPIRVSRQLLRSIQSGELAKSQMQKHPVFGFNVPVSCAGVESELLKVPSGPAVQELANRFIENFKRFESHVDRDVVLKGGPRI